MKLGTIGAGLVALATTLSCGKDSNGIADVLLVSTVEVSPSSGSIVMGGTAQLTATPKTAGGLEVPGRSVTWSSANQSIVAVSPGGLISAVALGGPVRITATVDGVSGESQITVQPFPVSRVAIAPGEASVSVGQSTQLNATAYDAGGSPLPGRVVSWQSSSPGIAAVTSTGMVLGIAAGGPVTITATAEGKAGSATVTVARRPASKLSFVQQPGTSVAGEAITPAVRIAIQDDQGNTITDSTGQVSIALGNNPGGASSSLSGTQTVSAVNGVATFSDLSLNKAGSGYTLTGSASGLTPATSAPFNIVANAANELGFITPPPSSAKSGVALSPQPVLQIRDHNGNAVGQAGVVVTASIASGTALLSGSTTATTTSAGTATFSNLTINGIGGTITLAFSAPGISAVTSGPISLSAGNPSSLEVTRQPSTAASSGVALSQQPAVALRDAADNPVQLAGVVVTASIAAGPPGGILGGATVVSTGSDGVAGFSSLALSGPAGSYTLRFSSSGLTAAVSNSIALSAGAGSTLALTIQPSSTAASGVVLAQQPAVQLRDAANNVVAQAGVAVTATIQSGGGTLGGTTSVTTDASGTARFSNLSISGTVGDRTLLFAAAGYVSVASSSITVTAGAPTQLTITTQPSSSAVSGVPFPTQPVLQIRDAAGNPVSQAGIAVSAAIASGGGTLGGTATVSTDGGGVASFTDLSITGTTGTRTLGFSAGALAGVTSAPISVGLAPPTQLDLVTQPPGSAQSGVVFSRAPVVQVENSLGVAVATQGIAVTVSVASGDGSAVLGGTLTVETDASGRATFNGLSLSGPVGSYTLAFAAPGLTGVTSSTITLAAGAAAQLGISTQPSSTAKSTKAFSVQPVIQLLDAAGNPVARSGVTVTAAIETGLGSLGGDLTKSSGSNGAAIYTDLKLTGAGTYTLKFSAPGLGSIISATITVSP